jgi:hypothetical protein
MNNGIEGGRRKRDIELNNTETDVEEGEGIKSQKKRMKQWEIKGMGKGFCIEIDRREAEAWKEKLAMIIEGGGGGNVKEEEQMFDIAGGGILSAFVSLWDGGIWALVWFGWVAMTRCICMYSSLLLILILPLFPSRNPSLPTRHSPNHHPL